jgi:hypothetical protein
MVSYNCCEMANIFTKKKQEIARVEKKYHFQACPAKKTGVAVGRGRMGMALCS